MTDTEPCIKLPGVPDDLSIRLPFGGEMKAVRDFTKGIPDDCTLALNLVAQLPPLLGGVECFLRLLDVIAKLQAFLEAFKEDIFSAPAKVGDVLEALGKMATCLPPGIFVQIGFSICDILKLIAKILRCIAQAARSATDLSLNIDLSTAEGNPALLDIMSCAQDNAQVTAAHVLAALKPLSPLLDMVKPLGDIAQLPLDLPSFDDLEGMEDLDEILAKIESIAIKLEEVAEAIC